MSNDTADIIVACSEAIANVAAVAILGFIAWRISRMEDRDR
jgi:hypothetical protein